MGNRTGFRHQAQENPEPDGQPGSVPEGAGEPLLPTRMHEADRFFRMFLLPHFLHVTSCGEESETSASKQALHSLHTYS